jgi:hypothetical protein
MSIIPALRRLRKEECEFEARLNYLTRSCLKEGRERQRERQ